MAQSTSNAPHTELDDALRKRTGFPSLPSSDQLPLGHDKVPLKSMPQGFSDTQATCTSLDNLSKAPRKPLRKINNKSDYQWFDIVHFKSSVFPIVVIPTLIHTAWSALVTVFYTVPPVDFLKTVFKLPNTSFLVAIVAIVVGLILAFRTNTAYERFWEGRKLWSALQTHARNMARLIWVHVQENDEGDVQVEKENAMHLIYAFATTTKHYLRMEYSPNEPDVAPFIRHVPWLLQDTSEERNLPLEISYALGDYINKVRRLNYIDPPTQSSLLSTLSAMMDCLTAFERIRNTPIPLAYTIHLKQILTLYLMSLPFQVVPSAGWATVLIVFIASFTLLGIESIGGEIENPFGYDLNDLPLDAYCDAIKEELTAVMQADFFITPGQWGTCYKHEKKAAGDDAAFVDIQGAYSSTGAAMDMVSTSTVLGRG